MKLTEQQLKALRATFPTWLIDEPLTAMEDGSRHLFHEDLDDLERVAMLVSDGKERESLIARIRHQMRASAEAEQC